MTGLVPVAGNGAFFSRPTHVGQTRESVGRDSRRKIKDLHQPQTLRRPTTLYVPLQRLLGGFMDCRWSVPTRPRVHECSFLYPFWRFLYPSLTRRARCRLFVASCRDCVSFVEFFCIPG